MGRIYTKLDDFNVAVIETQEVRTILNKETLQDQRAAMIKKHDADLAIIDEALERFEE